MKLMFRSLALVALVAAAVMAAEVGKVAPAGLVVHEWGTFTSVAGEDGNAIDWDALGCRSDLPGFVYDYGFRGFKWSLRGTVRMETPVLYFYSSRELTARVKVAFPGGIMTEWYPHADAAIFQKSGGGALQRLPRNLNGIDTSLTSIAGSIEWTNIKIQPDAAPRLPLGREPNRYYAARSTDSSPLTAGDEHEKFLFYRGVGRFPVPLSARVLESGKVALDVTGQGAVPDVVLFENRDGRIGYRIAGTVGGAVMLDSPVLDASLADLRRELESALVAHGLFPKEAQAMVETWRDSWFEEGSRLIYIVPGAAVDRILPLQVEPGPEKIERAFVGRIELITPAIQRTVESMIAKSDWAAVDRYERFLAPILQRMYSGDSEKVDEVKLRLRASRAARGEVACR